MSLSQSENPLNGVFNFNFLLWMVANIVSINWVRTTNKTTWEDRDRLGTRKLEQNPTFVVPEPILHVDKLILSNMILNCIFHHFPIKAAWASRAANGWSKQLWSEGKIMEGDNFKIMAARINVSICNVLEPNSRISTWTPERDPTFATWTHH